MPVRIPASLRSPVLWLLVATFALEFLLFDQFGARRYTAIHPRWHDQVQYLSESYTAFEFGRERGVVAGLLNALTNASGQGALHDLLAYPLFLLSRPSRSAALAVNMLALIAWQAALFAAILRESGSRALAFGCAFLPLALAGPWHDIPGSSYDFRLDHLAMCALGVTASCGVLTDGFRRRRATNWFGVCAGLTVLVRYLTGAYLLVAFAALALWSARADDQKTRLRHLGRAALIATLLAGPLLWLSFDSTREFYDLGNYFGARSALGDPERGLIRSARFVLYEVGTRHLGLFFAVLVGLAAIGFALLRSPSARAASGGSWILAGVFTFSPLLVLVLHPQRSEVLVGALAPGVVLLAAALWQFAARRASERALWIGAALAGGAVMLVFARAQLRPSYSPAVLADVRQISQIAERVYDRARAANLRQPRVAVDFVADSFDAPALRVLVYERKRVWMPFETTLPTGVAEPAEETVMQRLAGSDFVFVTDDGPAGPHPYDRKLAELRPRVRAWCDASLRATDRFTLGGRRMVLYQRRDIPFP